MGGWDGIIELMIDRRRLALGNRPIDGESRPEARGPALAIYIYFHSDATTTLARPPLVLSQQVSVVLYYICSLIIAIHASLLIHAFLEFPGLCGWINLAHCL